MTADDFQQRTHNSHKNNDFFDTEYKLSINSSFDKYQRLLYYNNHINYIFVKDQDLRVYGKKK